jgi:serine protease Do
LHADIALGGFRARFNPTRAAVVRTGFGRVFVGAVALIGAALWSVSGIAAPAPDGFADLAAKLLPAVVNISTTAVVKNSDSAPDLPQFPPGSPFEQFFKDFMEHQGKADTTPHKVTALGSGFIVDASGLVVTNNHVIADADQINVILHNEKVYKAKLVGRDPKADLALLKITSPDPFPFINFGDSDQMRVGDWVIAIGNPFGLGGSVTAGIVSARARDINAGPYDDFLQTDAAINKGNSGGPLLNMKGEVIGINTAIFSPSGGSIGIGFAIPSNEVKPVIADLQKFGKTRRGWLGVRIQSANDEIADSLGLPDHNGAVISAVTPNGPAAKAGIKAYDVIRSFDGKPIDEMRQLPRVVAETPINKQVDIAIIREGKPMSVTATVGELPDDDDTQVAKADAPPKAPEQGKQSAIADLGLSGATMSPSLRERYDLPADVQGVVVTDVDQQGAASSKGLRPGDVIVEAAQQAVKSPDDLTKRVKAAKAAGHKSVLLLVQSQGGSRFVAVRIDGKADTSDDSDSDN